MFKKEGIEITPQALRILNRLKNKEDVAKELIRQVKERRFKIAGGDMVKYLIKGHISPIVRDSEDVGS